MKPFESVVDAAHEAWPGITWTTKMFDGTFWIRGLAQNGREAQRDIGLRDISLSASSTASAVGAITRACEAIAEEVQPAFIDWAEVGR